MFYQCFTLSKVNTNTRDKDYNSWAEAERKVKQTFLHGNISGERFFNAFSRNSASLNSVSWAE